MSIMALCNTTSSSMRVTPAASAFRVMASRLPRSRRAVITRADQRKDDNPAANVATQIDESVKGLVEATKENSGLDERTLGSKNAPGITEGAPAELGAFSGLLPEIINGRGAMLGMLAAFGAEASTREPLFVQIQKAPVLIAGAFFLVILASVIPAIRGADMNKKGAGPFTPQAEVYNGRLAMVSFAALVLVETWKAGPGLVP